MNNTFMKSKRGDFIGLTVGLLMAFFIISMLVALLPGFTQMIDQAKGSDALNCPGYIDNYADGQNLSYNATMGTKSTIGCLGLTLYLPYLILGILIALVSKILYDKGSTTPQYTGGY